MVRAFGMGETGVRIVKADAQAKKSENHFRKYTKTSIGHCRLFRS